MYTMINIKDRWPTLQAWQRDKIPMMLDDYSYTQIVRSEELYDMLIDYQCYKLPCLLDFGKTNMSSIVKNDIPATAEGAEVFNRIYQYVVHNDNWHEGKYTEKGYVCKVRCYAYQLTYWVLTKRNSVELVLWLSDCWMRIVYHATKEQTNDMTGYTAFAEFKQRCKDNDIDINKLAISNGEDVKAEIPKVHIDCQCRENQTYYNAYHLDLNSAYMSGIKYAYPELAPVIDDIYDDRLIAKAQNNQAEADKLKAVLNMTQGFCQSKYCVINGNHYALAHLSKAAIEYCNRKIEYYTQLLLDRGLTVLGRNTDGIWFVDPDETFTTGDEGNKLGQYKIDHRNCKIRFKSAGAYEFEENGVYHPVLRGCTLLDKTLDRADWHWGDIYQHDAVVLDWTFDKDEGLTYIETKQQPVESKNEKNIDSLDDFLAMMM